MVKGSSPETRVSDMLARLPGPAPGGLAHGLAETFGHGVVLPRRSVRSVRSVRRAGRRGLKGRRASLGFGRMAVTSFTVILVAEFGDLIRVVTAGLAAAAATT